MKKGRRRKAVCPSLPPLLVTERVFVGADAALETALSYAEAALFRSKNLQRPRLKRWASCEAGVTVQQASRLC